MNLFPDMLNESLARESNYPINGGKVRKNITE